MPSVPAAARDELRQLYGDLESAIARHAPRCEASGRCCRFAEYDHVLFLTRLEAEALIEAGPIDGERVGPDHCPYQVGTVCTARDQRPLGCRIYFCDPSFREQQFDLSEEFLNRLKRVHRRWGIAWDYAPLVDHLRRLHSERATRPPSTPSPTDQPAAASAETTPLHSIRVPRRLRRQASSG